MANTPGPRRWHRRSSRPRINSRTPAHRARAIPSRLSGQATGGRAMTVTATQAETPTATETPAAALAVEPALAARAALEAPADSAAELLNAMAGMPVGHPSRAALRDR